MAFGQPVGPPASARQLQELLRLVRAAGHDDFRDARGPLGLNQRQAGGRFTRDEADELIERLGRDAEQDSEASPAAGGGPTGTTRPAAAPPPRRRGVDKLLEGVPTATLAAELQRRGWVVLEP